MRRITRLVITAVLLAAPASAQEFCPALTSLRADYPTPMSTANLGDYLTRVAQETNPLHFGLQLKESGFACPTPMGFPVACDILVDVRTGDAWDVLRDADGEGTPDCHAAPDWPHGTPSSLFVYVPILEPIPTPTPTPPVRTPTPPPTPAPQPVSSVDLSPVLTALELQAHQLAQLAERLDLTAAEVHAAHQEAQAWRETVTSEYVWWKNRTTWMAGVVGALASAWLLR